MTKAADISGTKQADKNLIARLWKIYIRPRLGTLLLALLFMIVVAAATAAYTWLFKFIVDSMQVNSRSDASEAIDRAVHFVKLVVPAVIGLTLSLIHI